MTTSNVEIKTQDGICDAYISYPEGKNHLPMVLLYMDAIGIRPRMYEMADHLASQGYYVLMPNLFYRSKKAPVVDYAALLPNHFPELINQVMAMAKVLTPEMHLHDAEAFLKFAKSQPQVDASKKGGTVGYCMGGALALRAAANFPQDFAATASFHAGGLATDSPSSPHLLFPKITAEIYIGHADKDQHMPPEQIEKVSAVLKEIKAKSTAEVYKDCPHGWTMKDLPAYNPAGEQKHWEKLLALFSRTLKA